MKNYIMIAGLCFFSSIPVTAVQAENITFDHGSNCRKNDTRGCTGDTTNCYQAAGDRIIMRSSVKVAVNPSGKSPRCIPSYQGMKKISVTTSAGSKFELEEPTKICIQAHIESGSGPRNLGKGFNVKCTASFEVQEVD